MKLLQKHFDTALESPDGIKKLRELILTLAMQGKLVKQDPKDQPASELLKVIQAEKDRLIKEGKIKKQKELPPIKPEEVPYEVPEGWVWTRLGEISAYIQRGKGPKYADVSSYRVISQKCIRWYGLDIKPARFIEDSCINDYEEIRFLKPNDLLWNSTGTGTIGRACLFPNELENQKWVVDSHVTIVRTVSIDSKYLWRFIQSPLIQNEIENSASGTTNQIELNTSTVIDQVFPLPPFAEQKRIVAKIDELMSLCDKLEAQRNARNNKRLAVHTAAINHLLTASDKSDFNSAWQFITHHFDTLYSVKENVADLKKAILTLAMQGKLVKQDPKDQPASELLKEIQAEKERLVKEGTIKKQKELPPIKPEEVPYKVPSGWEWTKLGSLSDNIRGVTYSKNVSSKTSEPDYIELLRANNINKIVNFDETIYVPIKLVSNNQILKEGDLLIALSSGSPHLVGKAAQFIEHRRCTFGAFCGVIRPFSSKLFSYFSLFTSSPIYRGQTHSYGKGIGIQNLTKQALENILFPLPPLAEQKRIVAKIDELMALCEKLEGQIDQATTKQTALFAAVLAKV